MFILNAIAISLLLLVVLFSIKYSKYKNGLELNFVLFFSFGYLYYFSSPLLFIAYFESLQIAELDVINNYLDGVGIGDMSVYGTLSVAYYVLLIFGYSIGMRGKPQIIGLVHPVKNNILKIQSIFFFAVLLVILAALPVRDYFFKGYDEAIFEGYVNGVLSGAAERGTYVAAVTVLFVCFLMKASNDYLRNGNSEESALIFYIKSYFFYVYLFFAILMVSMGGRLYLISHLIALCVMANLQKKYMVSWKRIVIIFFMLASILGVYGVFRANGQVNFSAIALNLVQEPFYTSISLFSYIGGGYWSAFRFPYFLISDFSNLLPSFIWKDKALFILHPSDFGFDIGTPLGGFHLFVTLMINFGYIGAAAIMFSFGWVVGFIRKRSAKWIYSVIYSLLVGWCTFSIFRDPFSVVFVKNIFQYSIILPVILNYIFFKKYVYK